MGRNAPHAIRNIMKGVMKSMELHGEKLENYQRNLWHIQDAADELLSHMKGYGVSFRSEIVDRKGDFSQEKLNNLVEKILSLWAAELRAGTLTDPDTGESLAEPYIQTRRELYGNYLYLVMRCTLQQGDYNLVCGGNEMKEQSNFGFLLKQARRLFRSWCVMAEPDGRKKNDLFGGWDNHFGFHLYRLLSFPEFGSDNPLTFETDWPMRRLALLTDEGYVNRLGLKAVFPNGMAYGLQVRNTETEGQSNEESGDDGYGDDSEYGDLDYDFEYDPDYDSEDYLPEEIEEALYEQDRQYFQKLEDLNLSVIYKNREEYLAVCKRFVELFQQAKPEVLWRFCEDLEMMIGLYLLERDIPPLADTDKTLDVYSRIADGPSRQARRYERGIQWENL